MRSLFFLFGMKQMIKNKDIITSQKKKGKLPTLELKWHHSYVIKYQNGVVDLKRNEKNYQTAS